MAKFPMGQIVATPGAIEVMEDGEITRLLQRHESGDWGEVSKDDWQSNDFSLRDRTRLLSAYTTQSGTRVWVITEADRSATTCLLPEEY